MRWSINQETALKRVNEWLKDDSSQLFRLFGYAGTGKTTLAKQLAESVEGQTIFAAFTGKAAQVLTQKGCPAQTIHSLIYKPRGKSVDELARLKGDLAELKDDGSRPHHVYLRDRRRLMRAIEREKENLGRLSFSLNYESDLKNASLLVIDECSMIDEPTAKDLLSFGTKILALGDPFQLPPVAGCGYFTDMQSGAEPDFMLTDVHRQAADSPVLALATQVREGNRLRVGSYGDSAVHGANIRFQDRCSEFNQILCGRNATRHLVNRKSRALLGRFGDLPLSGERMVCLRNSNDVGLLNGQIWHTLKDAAPLDEGDDKYVMSIKSEDNSERKLDVVAWRREPEFFEITQAQRFDFGYCLTTHKAQGSQWDDVLLLDESSYFNLSARWLYTGITRAANRIEIGLR